LLASGHLPPLFRSLSSWGPRQPPKALLSQACGRLVGCAPTFTRTAPDAEDDAVDEALEGLTLDDNDNDDAKSGL
jgi:hypothetical protein